MKILGFNIQHFLDGHPAHSDFFYNTWYWMYASLGQIIKDSHVYDINGSDKNGNTPLHLAVQAKRNPKVIYTILQLGADSNAQNNHGYTAYDLAQNLTRGHTKEPLYADKKLFDTTKKHTA